MMPYKIEVFYRTGDSFGSRDTSTVLEMEWQNVENAKKALRRIKEHYKWYKYENESPWNRDEEVREPDWHKGEKTDATVKLLLDNGNEVKFYAPWCGYFERLQSAKVFIAEDLDMEFSL